MNAIGIVAEYNPFHTGHGYQLTSGRTALGEDTPVVAVMSGNWVQQARCAVADKWTRAKLAMLGGADLVLELPTVYAMSSAEKFAQGAVEILNAAGVITHLSFGSECGDADKLARTAEGLTSPEYLAALRELTDSGLSFAACRQKAAEQVLGEELGSLLSTPNNNLGVEYIRALKALNSPIVPTTVVRKGAAHNTIREDRPEFLSATQIRAMLYAGDFEGAQEWIVPGGADILKDADLPDLKWVERAMLAKVRTMSSEDWALLPDSGQAEGLPRRLEKAGQQCRSMEEFFELAKTKRYPHARLRRLALWAWLGLKEADRCEHPPYIRVLGFNERGQELLKQMKKTATLPIVTKPAHARKLDEAGRRLFELESRCTDLYDLCYETIPAPGREWRMDAVRMGGGVDA